MVPLLLAAVLALTAVAVADRVEQRLVAPAAPAADVSSLDAAPDIAAAPVAAPLTSQIPLTSAALPAGEMVLTFADGSAAISTGANDPIFELGTTTIGDVDLSGIEPVLAQGDAEVSADWGDVSEWYRAVDDGIEHGYTVDAPVSAGDDLRVTVDVVAGEPSLVDGQTVAIERAEGGIVWYRGLFAFDANGADLPAEMSVVDGDIELQVDTAGAEYPITIDPIITDSQQLLPVLDASGDRFGESVAIDGVPGDLTIVVGAVGDRNGQGAAYVFHNDGSGWVQQAKLFAPTPGDRQFGWDVDVRGDVVVVGDPGDDANGTDAGAVFVFEPTGPSGAWQQTSAVYQCDPSVVSPCGESAVGAGFDGAGFGFAVDLTDQFLLVGAPRFEGSAGGAWLYEASGSDWQTSTAGVIAGTQPAVAGDEFGYAIAGADAGTHIVVGAPGYDAGASIDAGRTFYLQWDGSALSAPVGLVVGNEPDGNAGASVEVELDAQGDVWMFSGQPVNTRFEDGTEPGDSFAWRNVLPAGPPDPGVLLSYGAFDIFPALTAFSGTHVLHGESLADAPGTDSGRALFRTVLPDEPPAYNQLDSGTNLSLPTNAGDRWGFDVAAVGDTYVIGGPGNDAAGADAGEIRIGSFSSLGPLEVLSPDPDVDPRRLGAAVVVDGDRMVASAPFADVGAAGAGVVYVYERSGASAPWVLTSTIASPEPELNGGFGDSLDLRGDLLAVGESDRFGDSAEPGRVWVFELDAGVWSVVGGGFFTALPVSVGDHFGASLAWIDDTRLAVGAPGENSATGQVSIARLNPGESAFWSVTDLSTLASGPPPPAPPTPPLAAGDQLGFAVAYDDSPSGDDRLVSGAPGASRRYSWEIPSSGTTVGNPGLAQFTESWNMGSAVDIAGNRVVTSGISDQLRVNVNELLAVAPFQRSGTTPLGPVVAAGTLNETVNNYLDIEGSNVAVSRGGGGGQVELYTINDLLALDDRKVYSPPATSGDLVGWAIDLDGRSLIAGAPGTNADAGAVFSAEVPVVATWTGNSFLSFSGQANWDIGVVPGPGDTAIVPDSIALVDVDAAVGRLVVDGFAQVVVGNGFSLESGSTLVRLDGSLEVAPGGELVLRNDALVDGSITVVEGGGVGVLALDGDVAVSGTGTIPVLGELRKTGPGTATVDVDRLSSVQTTTVSVDEGTLELAGADLGDGRGEGSADGLVGGVSVAAGAELRVVGDLQLTNETSITVEIVGPSGSPANSGRVDVTGTLTKNGALNAALDLYTPITSDSYTVFDCGDCTPGAFAATDVEPLTVVTNPTSITLAGEVEPDLPTFTEAFDSAWSDPRNWSPEVVPGVDDSVVIPTGKRAFVDGTFGVGAVDVAGELDIGSVSTLDITGGPDGSLVTTVRSGGQLTVLSPDTLNIAASSVVVESGGALAVGTDARLVFNGTSPQTLSGAGNFLNDSIVRTENATSVNIADTLSYVDSSDSRLEVAAGEVVFGPSTLDLTDMDIARDAVLSLSAPVVTTAGNHTISGTLRVDGGATFDGDVTLIDGVLDGDITVGTGASVTLIDNPVANLDSNVINGSFTNRGSVLVDDVSLEFGPLATITNDGTWTWEASTDRRDIVDDGDEPTFVNNGEFTLVGPGALRINSNWVSPATSQLITTAGGDLTLALDVIELGTVFVAAGSSIDYRGSVNFAQSSVLDIEIIGASIPGNFGSVSSQAGVTVDPAATLRTSTGMASPSPTIFDRYTILDCGAGGCPTFATFETDLGLGQQIIAGDVVLTVSASVPTFVNTTGNGRWGDPLNWNPVGVPGANDSAVIPSASGVVIVDTVEAVADIDVGADSFVGVLGALDLTGGPGGTSVSRLAGLLRYDAPSVISSSIDFDSGELVLSADVGENTLSVDSPIDFTGTGEVTVDGTVRKIGPQPLTVADSVTWTAADVGSLIVDDGIFDFAGDYVLDGSTVIEPLAALVVRGDVRPGNGSVTILLDGPAADNNFGQLSIRGNLVTSDVEPTNIVADYVSPYAPLPTDAYRVIDCVDCGEIDQISASTGVLDLRIVPDAPEVIELFLGPCDTTFVGGGETADWANADNWSNGVPTASSVVCDEAGIVIEEGTDAQALRLEGDIQFMQIEGSLTLAEASEFTNGFRLGVTGSLNGAGEITVGSGPGPFTGTTMNVSGLVTAPLRVTSDTFLDIRDGARFRGAQIVNDGQVLVIGGGFALEDASTVVNNGFWVFFDDRVGAVEPPFTQTVTSAGAPSSFLNEGEIRVNAGVTASLSAGVELEFGTSSRLELDIGGTSPSGDFGRLVVDGDTLGVGSNAVLAARTSIGVPSPTLFDRYDVVDCGLVECPLFPITDLEPGVQQFLVSGDIVLGQASINPTFVDASGDGLWGTAANWTTGVVPGANDTVEIPAGVTALVDDFFEVGALDIAGQVDIDVEGTLNVTGGPAGDLPTSIRSTGSLIVLSADTLNIAAESVVVETGGVLSVGPIARLVFTGTAAQTVTGAGQLLHRGIIRNENPQSVTIAGTLDYVDGGDSSIEAAVGAFRFGPTDLGLTTVDIDDGATFEFTAASATAAGNFEVRGTLNSGSLGVSGIVQVRAGGLFVPDGTLDLEGGQVLTAELAPRGVIRLLDGASITGTGLVANSGDVVTTGAVTIVSGVTWNSGRNSLLDVQSGALDVQILDFDARGGLSVASAATLMLPGDTILRPSSFITIGLAADGTAGQISTGRLAFDRFADGDTDTSLARFELDLIDEDAPVGPITVIACSSDCSADPFGSPNAVEFDEFVTGDYDVLVGRNTVDVAILDNKNRSAAGGTGFGSSVSVDGDRAVVGSFDGITGPAVLERVDGVWEVVAELTDSSSVNVALDGDQFIADGVLYEFEPDISAFDATNVIGGTSFDFDGELALLGDDGATAQVFLRSDFATALAVLEPGTVPASYGSDVALLDLGGGSALAAVSAPDTGEVYIFEQVEGVWGESEVRTLTSPDGAGNRFGQSISISGSALVVGEPLNDSPRGDGGAAWVYPLEGTGLADTPVKLTPSEIDGGDQFGSDVSIDADVVIVGASVAQKFNFPIRDGAAFVFQFDGIDWAETDALRAPDAFSFEFFGDAVAVSGTDVLVGARRDRNSNGFEAGAVYDFDFEPVAPAINTFIGVGIASWADPANWSSGSVPVIGEPAIVPAGAIAEIPAGAYFVGALTLGGRLQMASGGTDTTFLLGGGSVIEPGGVLAFSGSFTCFDATDPECPSDNRLTIGGDLVIDGLLDVSVTTTGSETVFSKSIPEVVLADDTSVTGDGALFLAVPLVKSGSGTSTFGPDLDVELFGEPPRPAEDRGVLQVDEGTLDIQSTAPSGSFLPNGTIDVAAGASVSVAGDVTLSPTSELAFGIDGPAASSDNFGKLQVTALTSAGTLRTTLTGYTPVFDDLYPLITCSSCTSDPVTAFDAIDIDTFTLVRSADTVAVRGPELPVDLTFAFDRTSATTVKVGSSAIPVTELDRTAVVAAGGTASNVAASSVTLVGSEDNAIADIELKDTLIAEAILASPVLSSIPLVSIDITTEGGWSAIVAGVPELAREPLTSLTLGQVLEFGLITDETTPAGRVGALPLGSIDVEGTPLGSIPLGSIALGATPLGSIPLEDEATGENLWCVALEGFLEPGETCDEALLSELTATDVALRGAPLGSIPLGSIPLGSIDVADTPLGSIPLGSIDVAGSPLGSIPLGSIPLGSINVADTPLGSIGIADAPLGSIPLGSIPLGSIPLGSIPLGSIPLGSIALDDDSIASLETSLVVDSASSSVAGAPLGSIPLGSIALAQVPLGSIPLEENGVALSWCDVLADVAPQFSCTDETLESTTIAQLAVQGVPLGSIPLGSIPLGSIPLGSIDLADTPLGSIPLGSIPLGSIPLGSIPLGSIDLTGTPLGSIPLGSIPLGSIDLAGTPLGSIPLGSIPLGSIPLGSIPLGSIPLGSIPLGSIPLGSITVTDTPLGSIPLGSIPLGSIDVAGSPLGSIPLGSIPLGSISIDCAAIDCDTATLGEAVAAGAIEGDPVLADLDGALSGIRVADLIGFVDGVSEAQLRAAIDAAGLSLADLAPLDELTLLDIPSGLLTLEGLTLADLPTQVAALLDVPLETLGDGLNLVTFADVVDAIVDPITGAPIPGVEQSLVDAIAALGQVVADLDTFGDVTLGDLFASDGSDPALTLEAIEPILGFISVESFETVFGIELVIPDDLTIADLAAADGLGDLTLADLAGALGQTGDFDLADLLTSLGVDILDDYSLADLLFALLGPTSRAIGGVEFAEVDAAALPAGVVPTTALSASFQVDGSRSRTVDVTVELPVGSSFIPGSAELSVDGGDPTPTPPVVDGSQLTWTTIGQPGASYRIDIDVLAGASIGDVEFTASAAVLGTDVSRQDSATVTVEEGLEPFNFVTVDDTIAAQEDQVFFTYLSTETDVDVFEITVDQDDRIVVQLSNLDSDLDLVVWGRAGEDSPALTDTSNEAPLVAITDPDNPSIDAEPLDDFPQLDAVDPTLGIVATSNLSGTQDEALTTPRLDQGTYYVQVVGANSVTNIRPAAFQIGVIEAPARPVCQPIEFRPGYELPDPDLAGTRPLPADTTGIDTLILINERRLERLYGLAARQDVVAAAQRLVDGAVANSDLGISPAVVSVDAYTDVLDAYDAWDSSAGSCDPNAANAVVGAINDSVIDQVRGQLDHLVILGGDELIPMARLSDETTIANEYDFRNEFTGDLVGSNPDGLNAFTAPFWESMIRSDEPYGDAAARSLGDRFLYVSDVALGRVVETPSEIVEALDTYLAFDGQLAIETATVLGYDFLSDGSEAIADSLEQGTTAAGGDLPVDRELASGGADPGWDKDAAIEKLDEAGTRALVSLNAHFDHYRALPAIGDKDPLFTDNLLATQVAEALGPRALTRSLIFSMGCHSGLSVSDITIGGMTNSDWAQTLGQQGSLYIGNTGYGYGDTEAIAYTEQLMLLFAEQVTSPFDVDRNGVSTSSTVGEALTWAKNQYVSGLQTFSVYDEKAVMESTFYGLPFYRVGTEPAPLPPTPVNEPVADATGTEAIETTLQEDTPAVPQSTSLGTYFAGTDDDGNEEIIVAPGRPIQPKDATDISVVDPDNPSVLTQDALGAIVLEMDSTYQIVDDPVIASPTFVGGASLPETQVASGVFPTKQLEIATSTGPAGRRQTLVVATGQYDAGTQKQRLDTDIDVVVYYADPAVSDRRAPVVGGVEATIVDSVLTVDLTATDSSGVDRVYLLVAEDPGDTSQGAAPTVWRGLDLRRVASIDRWTGSLNLASDTDLVEFIVQAKDNVGNVGYATNKATNFSEPVVPPPPTPPPPPPAQLTVIADEPLETGWYEGAATVTVSRAVSDVIFSLNGVDQEPATPPATFEIVDDGVQNWTVRTVDGASLVSGQVRIDADGEPTVVFGAPTDGSTYTSGTRNLSVICADSSGADCRYTIAGEPIEPGDPLPVEPGDYVLEFIATDKVGNFTDGSITFTIEAVDATPSIEDVTISGDPQPIGVPVSVEASFTDASAPFDSYTATIDWGDGTVTTDPIVVGPTGPGQTGSISAEHPYDTVDVHDVTVTIVDGNGNSDEASVSVVVFDPDAAPVITGVDAPIGVRNVITDPVVVTTRFDDASVPEDSFTASVDWDDGDGPQPVDVIDVPTPTDIGSFVVSREYAVTGTYEVVVVVTDGSGNSDEERFEIEVVAPDGDPLITEVVGPSTPQSIADPVEIVATFSDESGSFDTYTATVDWGDGTPATAADVVIGDGETVGTITASRLYDVAGVYTVTVTIEDLAGGSDTAPLEQFVVVFDPDIRGRVSGSGAYWSGAEARPGSRWGAPAFFGYNARYRNNADVPSGRTQLRLVGDFFFRSTSYDYLIINDAIAIAEGTGRIGADEYRFRVQGIDDGRFDFFQISIWDPDTDEVIYDNGVMYHKGDLVLLGGIRVRS